MNRVARIALALALAWLAPRVTAAQDVSETKIPLGECAPTKDELCKAGEGMVGYAVNVPTVPKGSIKDDFPSCVGSISSIVDRALKVLALGRERFETSANDSLAGYRCTPVAQIELFGTRSAYSCRNENYSNCSDDLGQ
jgi:hypothetical protein